MKEINDGGPAFPVVASTGDPRDGVYCRDGMTLRDWFAGQALAGILSNHELLKVVDSHAGSMSTKQAASAYAFAVSDDMLVRRNKLTE